MGNRGCLHDERGLIVRNYQVWRWIICLLEFKNRKLEIMKSGFYTQLFFLDEVTALAAGHRPCAECQRERFNDFRQHWTAANPDLAGSPIASANTIDAALHRERISDHYYQRDKVKLTYTEQLDVLPDGVIVVPAASATPHLVLGDRLYPWSFEGYGCPVARSSTTIQVLTPRSSVRTLVHGYQPNIYVRLKI